MATVEGAFKIIDRASPVLERIDRKARAMDRTLEKAGYRMDQFAAKTEKDMKIAEEGVNSYARTAERSSSKVAASMGVMQRSISSAVSSSRRDIGSLQAQLATLDSQRASPNVEVDGVAKSIAEIKALKAELRSLDAMRSSAGAGVSGSGVAAGGGRTKGGFWRSLRGEVWGATKNAMLGQAEREIQMGTQRIFDRILGRNKPAKEALEETTDAVREFERVSGRAGRTFGSVGERIWSWTKIILALGPALESVGGALTGLIGSLGGGISGAATGLVGLVSTATVGFGGFLSVLIPTIGGLKESSKAMDKYAEAIKKYGRASEEADQARQEWRRSGDPNQRRLVSAWRGTKKWWNKATAQGQTATTKMLGNLITGTKNRFGNQFAGIANQSAQAMNVGNTQFLSTLDAPNTHRNLAILSDVFSQVTPLVGRTMANLGRVFLNIGAAAKPQTIEFFQWLDQWMRGANQDTRNLDKLGDTFERWTRSFKTWMNFFKQGGKLMAAFFGRGQKSGNNLLNEMSHQMREWREQIEGNPKGTENWIEKQTDNFKRLTRELGAMVAGMSEIVDLLSTMIKPISDINEFIRNSVGGGAKGTLLSAALWGGAIYGAKGLGRAGMGKIAKSLPAGPLSAWFAAKGGLKERGATPANPVYTREVGLGGKGGGTGPVVVPGGGKAPGKAGKLGKIGSAAKAGAKGLGWFSAGMGLWSLAEGNDVNTAVHDADPGNVLELFGIKSPLAADGPLGRYSGSKGWGNLWSDIKSPFTSGGKTDPQTEQWQLAMQKVGRQATGRGEIIGQDQAKRRVMKMLGYPGADKSGEDTGLLYTNGFTKAIEAQKPKVKKASADTFKETKSAIQKPVAEMVTEVEDAFDAMTQAAVRALVGMGFDQGTASNIVKTGKSGTRKSTGSGKSKAPSSGSNPFAFHGLGNAMGGTISGTGMQDTVPLGGTMVAPGESWIATRHQRNTINRMLPPGVSMEQIIRGDKRWHSSPMRRFAAGGQFPDAMGALPGLDALGAVLNRKFGLSVTSGLRPGAITTSGNPSDHGWGGAIDVSNGITTPQMDAAWHWLAQTIGGGGTPTPGVFTGGAIKQMLYRTMIGGDHFNHIHVALNPEYANNAGLLLQMLGGGAGAMLGPAGKFKRIQAPKSKRKGAAGSLQQANMDAFAQAMNQRVGRYQGAAAGGAGMASGLMGGITGGGGGSVESQIAQILLGRGFNKVGAAGIIGNAFAESNLNPTAMEPGTDNGGLFGFTAGEKSMASLRSFAQRMNRPWSDVATQVAFMLTTVSPQLRAGLNNSGSAAAAALLFMNEWERPGIPRADVRTSAAMKAFANMRAGGQVNWGGWNARGGKFTVNKPTLFGAGEAGIEDVHIKPRGSSGGGKKGGKLEVNIAQIIYQKDGDIREAIEREFERLADDLDDYVEDEDEVFA